MPENDGTLRLLADAVTRFLAHKSGFSRADEIYQRRSVLDHALWREMAEQGWLGLRAGELDGGSGLDIRHAAIVAEAFGRHAVPEPFVACAVMPAVLLAQLPVSTARSKILQGLIDGSYIATVAWQRHPQTLEVTAFGALAERLNDGYRLRGRIFGVVAATFADALLVHASYDGEPTLWHVPRNTLGIKVDELLASDGGSLAVIELDIALSEDARIASGPLVLTALQSSIDEATLLTACLLRGSGEAAFSLTQEHLCTRVQFDRAIGSFQSMQHAAVDVSVQLALARAACASALNRVEMAPTAPETRAAIAAAKARAADAALHSTRFAVQAHGASGFAAEVNVGLHLKSALRQSAWLGNASQQRQVYGRLSGLHEDELK